jgi:hypothetical protein
MLRFQLRVMMMHQQDIDLQLSALELVWLLGTAKWTQLDVPFIVIELTRQI